MIRGILRGEEEAIRKFHQKYHGRLLSYTLKRIDKAEDAEEIVQDALMSAIYSMPSFLGKSSLSSWLFSIVRHEIADFYRKRKVKELLFSHFPALEHIVDEALSPEFILERKRIQEKIIACFLQLTEGYRQILRLKYIEGLKTHEVAFELKISQKAAEMRLRRARLAFVEAWNNEEENQKIPTSGDRRDLSFVKEYLGSGDASLQDSSGN